MTMAFFLSAAVVHSLALQVLEWQSRQGPAQEEGGVVAVGRLAGGGLGPGPS